MSAGAGPAHVVVDGSNIATEGRSMPSLAQLEEAVAGFMEEHPDTKVTVVVDATFGHRIAKKEVKRYDEGIANNELVAPPAGAVGRGDAFVLGIADKADAAVLSNDSFQEFHGEYEWLFDEGRLIGGKPVPHVGWVFVDRVPVRGPTSRKATSGSKSSKSRSRSSSKSKTKSGTSGRRSRGASKEASEPMPVPTAPPPGATADAATRPESDDGAPPRGRAPRRGEAVNELLPFLEFVEHHPIGTSINGTVDAYSSHGAYIAIGDSDVRGYIPLRLMADPPPRSARQELKVGESVTAVVVSFSPSMRSIDCALPDMAAGALAGADDDADRVAEVATSEQAVASSGDAASENAAVDDVPVDDAAGATASGARSSTTRTRRKSTAKKATAKKSAAKKSTAKKASAKKATAKKATAKKSAAKKSTAKKASAKTSTAKRSAAKKSGADTSDAMTSTGSTPAKKTSAKKATAKKAPAKRSAAKKSAGKRTAAKRQPAAKSSATRRSTSRKAAQSRRSSDDAGRSEDPPAGDGAA